MVGLAPIGAVVLVVLVVLVGSWTLVGKLGGGSDSGAASDPAATKSAAPTTGQKPQETQQTESPAATTTEPRVDRSAPVRVLNNTATAGLAKRAADKLKNSGWTIAEVGDHKPRGSVAATTVYYADAAQQATAQAVADVVGAQTEQSQTLASSGITVVLAADYAP
jgi:hypothetical protein